ncbi:ferritin family protein [Candidatus Latescibacterota bacterium]
MKFNSDESINALKNAMEKEKAAEDFYSEKSQEIENPAVKNIFIDLATDEHKHFVMVGELTEQAESGGSSEISLPAPTDAKSRVEGTINKFKDRSLPELTDNTSVREALTFALEIERMSFNNYSQAAADSEDSEIAAVYRFLAGEENKHYIIIDNTLDFIDVQDRWIYEEENLIFRL